MLCLAAILSLALVSYFTLEFLAAQVELGCRRAVAYARTKNTSSRRRR